MFGVSGSQAGILIFPGESLSIPFNKLITFTFPEEDEDAEILNVIDKNGKRWTITLSWGGYPRFPRLIWEIEGVGRYYDSNAFNVSDYKAGNEMVGYFTFATNSNVSFYMLPSFAYGKGPDFATYGTFVNGITRSPTFLTPSSSYDNFSAGTTIEEFTTFRDSYYYVNICNNKIEFKSTGYKIADYYGWGFVHYIGNQDMVAIYNYIMQYAVSGPSIIPGYIGIPDSTPGGNTGTYDFVSSDDIDFPNLPSTSAIATGFISLWSPTNNQLLRLAQYMWNDDILTGDFWKKLIASPIDLIFGLSLVPLNLSNYIDGTRQVTVGWINTQIMLNHLSTQWVSFDCGEIDLTETWGAYLDYDPFTKLEIYLPFCGFHPLKIDDFMPGKIKVVYNIDLLSGSCVAMVKSSKSDEHGDTLDSIVYQFMGNCATQIPITTQQFADAIRSAISIAASIGSMIASSGSAIGATASSLENVMNIKPSIERSGAIGSSGSLLAVKKPYLILTRPRQAKPADQNIYTGYPSFITESLGSISGWTIVQAIHLDNIPCTANEMNEIDSLLKAGVIF